ncbi:MAG: Mu-like prophage major head subunit gpT family protein [Planctomycetes bacterium]|nr:Mu-like prophage major head subunit gpT family protein [Planctomycetota bacterium]
MKTATTDIVLSTAAVEITAAEASRRPSISIVAYTGGVMRVPNWGPLVIDLAGLECGGELPLLVDHDPGLDNVLGKGQAQVREGRLLVAGSVASATAAAKKVLDLARDGFPLQASVGVAPEDTARIAPGENVQVNGRTLTAPQGGLTLVSKGKLREVSVVTLGCDDQTAVAIAASRNGRPDEERIRQEERERLAVIEAACQQPGGWGAQEKRVADLKARAIDGELSVKDLQAELLHILRASRPAVPMIASGAIRGVSCEQAVEAALLMRLGREKLAEKALGPEVCGQAKRLGAAHALDLCRAALEADGREIPSGRMELVKASLSTYSLPAALGNVANKLLLDAYEESPATWRALAAIRSVADFKPNTAIRPSFTGQLEQLAPGGELRHGSVRESVTTFKVDTFGRLLGIDRRDLVNDDLSVFEETSRAMGKAAMRKVSDLVYETLLANAGGFFSAANGNLLTGVDAALGPDSLAKAIQAMQTQRDEEANDLDIRPATLLVPPELAVTAKSLLESEFVQRMAEEPTGNSLRRAVALEVEPRLSNAAKFKGQASSKHWYLFAAPSACSLIVAFLNGKQAPTVEYFGLEQEVDRLAVSWRVYHDFGASLCDPRAAVRSAGE